MNISPEYLETLDRVVRILAPSFTFGFYDLDDVMQEARIMGLECIERYDEKRPLENFLYTHIRNRLLNLQRDKLRRNDPPCLPCHMGTPCVPHGYCEAYARWLARNNAKTNLMRPLGMDALPERAEPEHEDHTELWALIDAELPVHLRADYLMLKAGVSLPKSRRDTLLRVLRDIVGGSQSIATDQEGDPHETSQ